MLYDKLQLNNIIPLTFLWKLGFEATNHEVENWVSKRMTADDCLSKYDLSQRVTLEVS